MEGLLKMAAGVIVSASLIAVAHAAPAPNATGSDAVNHKHGMQNAKKAQQSRIDRDKKVRAVKKRARAMRQQPQKERPVAHEETKVTGSAM